MEISYVNQKEITCIEGRKRISIAFDENASKRPLRPPSNSSGVYICKSIVNDIRHGNFICKSEGIYLVKIRRVLGTEVASEISGVTIPVEFTYVNQ